MRTIETFYYDVIAGHAAKTPDKNAIVMGDVRLTYSELLHTIDQVAAALLNRGLQRGQKVVLWATACPIWHAVYYGIIRAGGVAVILNANLTVKDAKALVEFADSAYLLFGKSHDIEGVQSEAETLANAFSLPVDHCLSILETDFLSEPANKPDTTGWNVRDDAYIIYTSGTTAFPKAVLTSQFAITNLVSRLVDVTAPIRGDCMVLGVPLFHAYAIYVSWIYLSVGSTVCLPDRIKADVIANLVEQENATDLWSVATIYQGIIDNEKLAAKVAPRVRICTIAGSYTSPVQFMRFESALYNATFLNMYGMTETSATYTTTRPDDDISIRYNTVGRAVEGIEAAAWDEQRGILPPGEVGEVITRGYHLKNSYYKLPPEKQAIDEDGWLHSGDLGVFDEQGNLQIVGRIKDLIIKGGENLAPAEIEAQVMSHPAIGACRIFGYKDRIYGENLAACVTIAPGATFDEADVKRYVKEKVGSYKSPVYYFVYDQLPLNANGKVDQRNLHIDMLKRLHRLVLEGKLDQGIQIMSLSVKNSTYNINPVAVLFGECALNLGFQPLKARKIRQAVEEVLLMRVNEQVEDIGDIQISLHCMQNNIRITIQDPDMAEDPKRARERKISSAIVLRLVDDCSMKALESGSYQVTMDFTYDKDFDVRDFLLMHEPLN